MQDFVPQVFAESAVDQVVLGEGVEEGWKAFTQQIFLYPLGYMVLSFLPFLFNDLFKSLGFVLWIVMNWGIFAMYSTSGWFLIWRIVAIFAEGLAFRLGMKLTAFIAFLGPVFVWVVLSYVDNIIFWLFFSIVEAVLGEDIGSIYSYNPMYLISTLLKTAFNVWNVMKALENFALAREYIEYKNDLRKAEKADKKAAKSLSIEFEDALLEALDF